MMIQTNVALWCVLLGAALALWRMAAERERRALLHEITRLERWLASAHERERVAVERLMGAWRDGYTVPTAADLEGEDGDQYPDLPAVLADWLDQWDDLETRARWHAFFSQRMASGRSQDAALADAELQLLHGRARLERDDPYP